ncbi:unnamed protein product [Mortierella alpina]
MDSISQLDAISESSLNVIASIASSNTSDSFVVNEVNRAENHFFHPGGHLATVETFAQIPHQLTSTENVNRSLPASQRLVETRWIDFTKGALDFDNLTWFRELQHRSPEIIGIDRTINVEIARDVAIGFDEMLKNSGSPIALQGYFVWKAVKQLVGLLAPTCRWPVVPVNSTVDEGRTSVSANHTKDGRRIYCARVVNTNLGRIAGHFFVRKTFSRNRQVAADKVAKHVRQAFIKAYGSQGWLSKTELVNGLSGRYESVVTVGHDGGLNDSLAAKDLKVFYKDYRIDKENYIRNRIRYAPWHRKNPFNDVDDGRFMEALQRLPQDMLLAVMIVVGSKCRLAYYNLRFSMRQALFMKTMPT